MDLSPFAVRPKNPTPQWHSWALTMRDLWQDIGDFTIIGMASAAMDGEARFDAIQLLRSLENPIQQNANGMTDLH
jgi:hypothetical protein